MIGMLRGLSTEALKPLVKRKQHELNIVTYGQEEEQAVDKVVGGGGSAAVPPHGPSAPPRF